MKRFSHSLAALFALLALAWAPYAAAATAEEIDAEADRAMALLRSNVTGAESLLRDAHGVLIMPAVIKAGIGIGGEYGEGVLRIDGKAADYYSIASASIGLQLGAQKKDIILLFMQEAALKRFRASTGWKAGVDGSVALVEVGTGGAIDTVKLNQPILGFVVGQKGLMANLTLEGSKFTKLVR